MRLRVVGKKMLIESTKEKTKKISGILKMDAKLVDDLVEKEEFFSGKDGTIL